MWKCPKCGEEIDGQFDSCWRCAKVESVSESVDISQPNQRRGGFWCAWRRGWYVLLMIAVFGMVEGLLRIFYQQSVRTYFSRGGTPLAVIVVLATGVLVLPACAYWVFVLFFGPAAWPWRSAQREISREARARALLDEATKLEIRGHLKEAMAKYQTVVERFGGTEASHDAEKSIESLRGRVG